MDTSMLEFRKEKVAPLRFRSLDTVFCDIRLWYMYMYSIMGVMKKIKTAYPQATPVETALQEMTAIRERRKRHDQRSRCLSPVSSPAILFADLDSSEEEFEVLPPKSQRAKTRVKRVMRQQPSSPILRQRLTLLWLRGRSGWST